MLTVVYITSRESPRFDWFLDSLHVQAGGEASVIVVDLRVDEPGRREEVQRAAAGRFPKLLHVEPMPNVWQGKHRLTAVDCWAISTAKNTGLCLATTDWIAFCDDLSVLSPTWYAAVQRAASGRYPYVVAGAYQKVHDLVVEGGRIVQFTEIPDRDPRMRLGTDRPVKTSGSNLFGCTQALPVEWMLKVNGFDETCNTVGLEDCMFGCMLANNGYGIRYDYSMMLIEDRTPSKLGAPPKRRDKGVSPNDKSHSTVARCKKRRSAGHARNLRAIRASVLAGGDWPIPTEPTTDWWDGQPLNEIEWHP